MGNWFESSKDIIKIAETAKNMTERFTDWGLTPIGPGKIYFTVRESLILFNHPETFFE